MSVLFVIMCIAVIVLIVKNNSDSGVPSEGGYPDNEDDDTDTDPDIPGSGDQPEETADAETDKLTKSKSYEVNQDTGEIQLEVAEDFNSSVNVPLAVEERKDKIENAKKERPYGIDSAFDVVADTDVPQLDAEVASLVEEYAPSAPAQVEETVQEEVQQVQQTVQPVVQQAVQPEPVRGTYTEVKEAPKQKVVLPGQDDEEE